MGNPSSIYKLLFLLIYGLILSQFQSAAQQSGNWMISKVLNANTGLAQNSVNALYFDPQTGFLWIGTEGGLTLYNGVTTKNYDTRNAPSFRMARIDGFFSTYDKEVIALDKTGTGVCIKDDSPVLQQHADYSSYYTIDFGVLNLPGIKDSTIYREHVNSLEKKTGEKLKWLTFLDDTTVLALSNTTAYFIGKKALKFNFSFPATTTYFAYPMQINKFQYIFLQKNYQGYLVDGHTKTVSPVTIENPEVLKGSPAIYNDPINCTYVLLNGKAVYKLKFKNDTLSFEPFAVLPGLPTSISSISIHPDNNRIFIGSQEKGVFIYSKSSFYTYQFNDMAKYTGNNKPALFSHMNNLYASVLPDTNHLHVFYNSSPIGGGIVVNLDNGRFNFSPIDTSSPFKVTIDAQKNIYYEWGNLRKTSFINEKIKEYIYTDISPGAFYYDIKYDKIWAIDQGKHRLLQLNGDSCSEYMHLPANENTDFIETIKRVNDVLLAYNTSAIFRIDEQHKKLVKVYDFKEPLLRDVHIDKDGYVWISTYGKGIYMYNPALKKLYHPPIDPAGNLSFCHSFIEDEKDNFFIPTNNGLYHIGRKNLLSVCEDSTEALFYHYYDMSNGLLTNEFNGGCSPAFNKLPNGDILIPSMQGMVRVFTSSLTKAQAYPLFIQKVSAPRNSYTFQNDMTFQSNERTLTWEINFAQWEYSAASGLSYRLDDETSWTPLNSGERKIILSELKGGNHTLHIRNQFDLEGRKASQLVVNFYVDKKYFEKAWFWLLITLALMAIIYLATYLRNLQLRRANLALEKKIHSKTIEIKNKNINLEKTLTLLEQNSQFQQKLIGLLGHDIMTPLKSINKVADQLINYRQKLKEETTTGAIVGIANTSTQLLFLSESIIQWIKVQEGQFVPRYSCFELHDVVEEISSLHAPLGAEKKNRILNNVPEVLLCVQDPTIIKIILHNLLLNANKFTTSGTIHINASMHDEKLQLTVTDDGVGMDTVLVEKLKNMQTGFSEKGTNDEVGWGLGYSFIFAMIKLVNGEFLIESTKGKGTKVNIEFPANNS